MNIKICKLKYEAWFLYSKILKIERSLDISNKRSNKLLKLTNLAYLRYKRRQNKHDLLFNKPQHTITTACDCANHFAFFIQAVNKKITKDLIKIKRIKSKRKAELRLSERRGDERREICKRRERERRCYTSPLNERRSNERRRRYERRYYERRCLNLL